MTIDQVIDLLRNKSVPQNTYHQIESLPLCTFAKMANAIEAYADMHQALTRKLRAAKLDYAFSNTSPMSLIYHDQASLS